MNSVLDQILSSSGETAPWTNTSTVVTVIDDPRVRYLHRDNGVLGRAQDGVAHSAGEYVTILVDDDAGAPDWLGASSARLRMTTQ